MTTEHQSEINPFILLARLRSQAVQMHELNSKIAELEAARSTWSEQRMQLDVQIERYRQVKKEWEWFFDNSLDILCVVGLDGFFLDANKATTALLGLSKEELLTRSFFSLVHPDDMARALAEFKKVSTGSDRINIEVRSMDKNGDWRCISWTTPGFSTETNALYAIGRDITDQKSIERQLLFQVQHDALTKLSNRMMFDQSLRSAISRAERNPAVQVALLIIDLDGFKLINDTHGHSVGDHVLKTIAARYMEIQRKTDVVCRLGGDEFSWLIEGAKPLLIDVLVKKIADVTALPIEMGGLMVRVGCSVGAAVFGDTAHNADALYEQADADMFSVKKINKTA